MGAASNNEASSVAVRRRGCLDMRAAGIDDLSMGWSVSRSYARPSVIIFLLQDRNIVFFGDISQKSDAELAMLALDYCPCWQPAAAAIATHPRRHEGAPGSPYMALP
jgi:hypothetical protein